MAMASIYTFFVQSMVCDYHEYIVGWNNPVVGKDLLCEHEIRNSGKDSKRLAVNSETLSLAASMDRDDEIRSLSGPFGSGKATFFLMGLKYFNIDIFSESLVYVLQFDTHPKT